MEELFKHLMALKAAQAKEIEENSRGMIYWESQEDAFEAMQWALTLEPFTVVHDPILDETMMFLAWDEDNKTMGKAFQAKKIQLATKEAFIMGEHSISVGAVLACHPKTKHMTKADQLLAQSILHDFEEEEDD